MTKTKLEEVLGLDLKNSDKIDDFTSITVETLIGLFGLNNGEKKEGVNMFLENDDHGLIHSFNVYKKAIEIAGILETLKPGLVIDKTLIYIMSIAHDSGRFHINPLKGKRANCERKHNKCAIAQVKLVVSKLKKLGKHIDSNVIDLLTDYLLNHDYFNKRLDPEYTEPKSLEGQIVRLADRISVDIVQEIDRYWETGKRLKTPYFVEGVSFEERVKFDFTKVREYIKAGKFDEFTFFLALISMSEDDFNDDNLKSIYRDWAKTKTLGVDRILNIAIEEGYSVSQINDMKELISRYKEYFNLKF